MRKRGDPFLMVIVDDDAKTFWTELSVDDTALNERVVRAQQEDPPRKVHCHSTEASVDEVTRHYEAKGFTMAQIRL